MRIRWHGHSCFEFTDSRNSVIVDPHDGKSIGIKPPMSNAGIVLVTHDHFDHNAVRMIKNERTVVNAEIGKQTIKGIEFEGFPSLHDDCGGQIRGTNTIYRFKMDGITLCHCGDLGDIPSDEVMGAIKNVDILFVPVGEVFTLLIPKVREFIKAVEPKIVVPMHYRVGGVTVPLKTLDEFLADVPKDKVVYVGNEIELMSDEISEFGGICVFDR